MTKPAAIPADIDRPTSADALRLEAARARANAASLGRSQKDVRRDNIVADAFDGLADNQEYLDQQT